jgi:hypothetical protein
MIINRFSIIIFFVRAVKLSLLCNMKLRLITILLVFIGSLTSCKSEYEERLAQGRQLKERLATVQESYSLSATDRFDTEITEITNEINFLAKVSGHEQLFLEELFEN